MADENTNVTVEEPVSQNQTAIKSQLELQEEEDLLASMQKLEEDSFSAEFSPEDAEPVDGVADGSNGQPSATGDEIPEVKAEEPVAEGSLGDKAQELVEEKVDTIEDIASYKGNYTYFLARALDNIGRVFGEDSLIGASLHRAAAQLEQQFGDPSTVEEEFLTPENAEKVAEQKKEEGEQADSAEQADSVADTSVENPNTSADNNVATPDDKSIEDSGETKESGDVGKIPDGAEVDGETPVNVMAASVNGAPSGNESATEETNPVDLENPYGDSGLFTTGETNLESGAARDVVLDAETEAMRDAMDDELMARMGLDIDKVDAAQNAMSNSDSASFVDELSREAAARREGKHAASTIHDFDKAMAQNVQEDPVAAGQSIGTFGDIAKSHISSLYAEDSPEYANAMADLSYIQKSMTQDYYQQLLSSEQSGKVLTPDQREQIDNMNFGNDVVVPYSEFVPDKDISIQLDADAADIAKEEHQRYIEEGMERANTGTQELSGAEVLRTSDGKVLEDASEEELESNRYMAQMGKNDVTQGHILSSGTVDPDKVRDTIGQEDFQFLRMHMDAHLRDLRSSNMQIRTEMGDEANEIIARNYMTTIRGLQAYNNAAVDQIRVQYADDPEKMQQATDGLANIMRNSVGKTWDVFKNDDDALRFFSEEDLAELESMQFTGINVSYGDYSPGMNLKTGEQVYEWERPSQEMSLEDAIASDDYAESPEMRLYANLDVPAGSWAVDKETINKDTFISEPVFEEEREALAGEQQVLQRNAEPSIFKRLGLWLRPSQEMQPGMSRGDMAAATFGNVLANEQAAQKQHDDMLLGI